MLTKSAILKAVEDGRIRCTPFDPKFVGPNSLDLHLDSKLLVYEGNQDLNDLSGEPIVLDPRRPNPTSEIIIPEEGLILKPGVGYLAATREEVGSTHFVPTIEGRSSLGRLFLTIHETAGFGDLGFIAQWTLELSCKMPFRLYPGMKICQMAFHSVEGEIAHLYEGKYGKKAGVEASSSHLDYQKR